LAAVSAACLSAGASHAETPDDPLRFFAHCTGRLAAEMSHRWLFADQSADDIEVIQRIVLDLLATLSPTDAEREVLAWRVEARAAHAALLSRATFRGDPWASERAAREIARCTAFVVGPSLSGAGDGRPDHIAPVTASAPIR
ncbi:MAG: hypothetical protein AAF914_12730, partial [Pseudomonadota bacterium]